MASKISLRAAIKWLLQHKYYQRQADVLCKQVCLSIWVSDVGAETEHFKASSEIRTQQPITFRRFYSIPAQKRCSCFSVNSNPPAKHAAFCWRCTSSTVLVVACYYESQLLLFRHEGRGTFTLKSNACIYWNYKIYTLNVQNYYYPCDFSLIFPLILAHTYKSPPKK